MEKGPSLCSLLAEPPAPSCWVGHPGWRVCWEGRVLQAGALGLAWRKAGLEAPASRAQAPSLPSFGLCGERAAGLSVAWGEDCKEAGSCEGDWGVGKEGFPEGVAWKSHLTGRRWPPRKSDG